MKARIFLSAAAFFVIFLVGARPGYAQMDKMTSMGDGDPVVSRSAEGLRSNLRVLWEDHGIYTRNVILNIIDGLPGTEEALARLLRNQDDIGNAIKPIYGEAAGKKLTELLREHIVLAGDLLKAAKKNDQAAFKQVNTKWFANADEISVFLGNANPKYWPAADMKKMMHTHLDLTTQEAVARLKKDYKGDVIAFDKTRAELLEMSDMLANGIIKQFPDKFKD